MPTPLFNFRLPADQASSLREVSRVYGSPNPSVFLRELVGSVVSGDPKKTSEFLSKLMTKMGEQLAFEFVQNATKEAEKRAGKGRKRPTARKGPKRR